MKGYIVTFSKVIKKSILNFDPKKAEMLIFIKINMSFDYVKAKLKLI